MTTVDSNRHATLGTASVASVASVARGTAAVPVRRMRHGDSASCSSC
jgi:hypothetical protein